MKLGRKLVSLLLALVMVFSLTATASAAEKVTVKLSPNITVTLNGEPQAMYDVNGNPVYPVLYGGTTYLPVRAVGNMLGLDVDWDQATQTVLLTPSDGKAEPNKSSGKAPTDAKPTDITVSINPNITVKLNGETREMTNVNGDPVYPMLYGGTTYLPIRAVSDMLWLLVDWDGATQTVLLRKLNLDGLVIDTTDRDATRKSMEAAGYTKEEIDSLFAYWDDPNKPPVELKTSADAKVLGENHIGRDWTEIDWSTADQGYVRVKVNEQLTAYTDCTVRQISENGEEQEFTHWALPVGWTSVPLLAGSGKYAITVSQAFSDEEFEYYPDHTDEMLEIYRSTLQAVFNAEIENSDAIWLLSNPRIDFENAPKVTAKAEELTKNCKTDAEKITAIFNWVANNIKYDYDEYNQIIADGIKNNALEEAGDTDSIEGKYVPGEYRPLTEIFDSKLGICNDYARLMAGMLRSVGVPCKYISGTVYDGKVIPGYNDNNPGWMGHAWVSVSPDTEGLNKTALGVGTEPDGWLRLDPTWGGTASGRADAAVDKNHKSDDCC